MFSRQYAISGVPESPAIVIQFRDQEYYRECYAIPDKLQEIVKSSKKVTIATNAFKGSKRFSYEQTTNDFIRVDGWVWCIVELGMLFHLKLKKNGYLFIRFE